MKEHRSVSSIVKRWLYVVIEIAQFLKHLFIGHCFNYSFLLKLCDCSIKCLLFESERPLGLWFFKFTWWVGK
ncbi:unnamed protein product [Prunus brigantina]